MKKNRQDLEFMEENESHFDKEGGNEMTNNKFKKVNELLVGLENSLENRFMGFADRFIEYMKDDYDNDNINVMSEEINICAKKVLGARKASKKLKLLFTETILAVGIGSAALNVNKLEKDVHEHDERNACCFMNDGAVVGGIECSALQVDVWEAYNNIKNSLDIYERSLQADVETYVNDGVKTYNGQGINANKNSELITLEQFENLLAKNTNTDNSLKIVTEVNKANRYLNNCAADVTMVAEYVAAKEITDIFGLPDSYISDNKIKFHKSLDNKYYCEICEEGIVGDKIYKLPKDINVVLENAEKVDAKTNVKTVSQFFDTCQNLMNKNTALGVTLPNGDDCTRMAIPYNNMYVTLAALGCLSAAAGASVLYQEEKTKKRTR